MELNSNIKDRHFEQNLFNFAIEISLDVINFCQKYLDEWINWINKRKKEKNYCWHTVGGLKVLNWHRFLNRNLRRKEQKRKIIVRYTFFYYFVFQSSLFFFSYITWISKKMREISILPFHKSFFQLKFTLLKMYQVIRELFKDGLSTSLVVYLILQSFISSIYVFNWKKKKIFLSVKMQFDPHIWEAKIHLTKKIEWKF